MMKPDYQQLQKHADAAGVHSSRTQACLITEGILIIR